LQDYKKEDRKTKIAKYSQRPIMVADNIVQLIKTKFVLLQKDKYKDKDKDKGRGKTKTGKQG